MVTVGAGGETDARQVRLGVLVARIELDDPLPQGDRLVEASLLLGGQGGLVLGRDRSNRVLGGHGDASRDAHLGGGLENLGDDGDHLVLAGAALEERNRAPADERDDSGHRLDLERLGDLGGLVDIHLDELEGTRVLARDILQHGQRRLRFERARRPHDQDDGNGLRRRHDVLEAGLVGGGDERNVQTLPRGRGALLGSGGRGTGRQIDGPV